MAEAIRGPSSVLHARCRFLFGGPRSLTSGHDVKSSRLCGGALVLAQVGRHVPIGRARCGNRYCRRSGWLVRAPAGGVPLRDGSNGVTKRSLRDLRQRIFHMRSRRLRDVGSQQPAYHMEAHIKACRDPRGRDDLAVVDIASVVVEHSDSGRDLLK